MRSKVSICNLALSRISGHQLDEINGLDEESQAARLCKNSLPFVVETALSYFAWNFATKQVRLALTLSNVGTDGYSFRYALPADCLRFLRLAGGSVGYPPPCAVQGNDILTDVEHAELIYIANTDTTNMWPPRFASAVAWGLAAELSTSLINDIRRQQFCQQQYALELDQAKADDLNANTPRKTIDNWEAARGW